MPANPLQWPLTPVASGPCWGANQGQATFINQDPVNTVYLGYSNSITIGGQNTMPLPPSSSTTLSPVPNAAVYAVALLGTAPLVVMPGTATYSSGLPLVASLVQNPNGFAVSPAQTVTVLNLADVSQFSAYDITLVLYNTNQATAESALTAPIVLEWFDDLTSGIPVYSEIWDVWISNQTVPLFSPNGQNAGIVFGTGPMHGRYLTISVSEVTGVTGINAQFFNVFGTSRSPNISTWRQTPPPMSVGVGAVLLTTPNQISGPSNILIEVSSGVMAANTPYMIPIGLYSGPVSWGVICSQASVHPLMICTAAPGLIANGNKDGTTGLLAGTTTALGLGVPAYGTAYLPRSVCYTTIESANAADVWFTVTAGGW